MKNKGDKVVEEKQADKRKGDFSLAHSFDDTVHHVEAFKIHQAAKAPAVEETVQPPEAVARSRMYPPAFFDDDQQAGFEMFVDEAQKKGLIRSRWQIVLALVQGAFEQASMQILENIGVSCCNKFIVIVPNYSLCNH